MASNIDPKKSFWKDYVTYPYPVKYANAKDSRGTSWQVGYMDEYAGTDKDPKVLVIIHGKGAFGGHYGNIMQYALRSGLRVIVPDLPHYGMSGPGNLDKSPARTMQDMREVSMTSWSNSSGSRRHLSRPLARRSARLGLRVDLAGCGAGPRTRSACRSRGISARHHDRRTRRCACSTRPSAAISTSGRRPGTRPGSWPRKSRVTEQNIRDFYYFKKRDPDTGAVSAAKSGYFMNDSEYARLHTEQRVGLTKGNPKELEQWSNVFIFDIYSMGRNCSRMTRRTSTGG